MTTGSGRRLSGDRLQGDRGAVGGIEALPLGVLVFVVGALLVANAWAAVDAKFAVTAAAREATRTYVEAADHTSGVAGADRAARDAIAGFGRDPGRLALAGPTNPAGFRRCARIVFDATYTVPAISLPWIGGFGSGVEVTATHTEVIDPFRDGVAGTTVCS
jgi:hypothetical protein